MSASRRSSSNVFAALALERAAERRDDADWLSAQRAEARARYIVLNPDGRGLARADRSGLRHLSEAERRQFWPEDPVAFLGATREANYFAIAATQPRGEEVSGPLRARWLDLRAAGLSLPAFDAGLFAYARALLYWQTRVRYCGVCGQATTLVSAGHKALCTNRDCGIEHFPRTDPAIIVIVGWRDACLLGRQPGWPEGRWSTLAGFVEPGESLEDAVRREVREEAGVEVEDCDYHSSQPWPFPASLMLGFVARAGDPAICVGAELAEARWFEVDDIVRGLADRTLVLPPPLSVSHRLIEHWLREAGGLELSALMHDEPWLKPKTT
ncbi:MAG: NAD(+) diphosphatase [Rhodanobacteraceae bacterium]|nr:NAD(+) diphosphatase [Rhodanobacteraceae bacterium]